MKILETYIVKVNISSVNLYQLLYFCSNNKWMLHHTHSSPHDWQNINEVTEKKALELISNTT